jgi:hypothetical protein
MSVAARVAQEMDVKLGNEVSEASSVRLFAVEISCFDHNFHGLEAV